MAKKPSSTKPKAKPAPKPKPSPSPKPAPSPKPKPALKPRQPDPQITVRQIKASNGKLEIGSPMKVTVPKGTEKVNQLLFKNLEQIGEAFSEISSEIAALKAKPKNKR